MGCSEGDFWFLVLCLVVVDRDWFRLSTSNFGFSGFFFVIFSSREIYLDIPGTGIQYSTRHIIFTKSPTNQDISTYHGVPKYKDCSYIVFFI